MLTEQKNQKGFSLIEVIVVVAIGGIIAAVAVPSFRVFMERYRTKGAARDVVSVIQQARAEAVRRSRPIALEFTAGTGSAANVRIFVDDGGNTFDYDAGEVVVSTITMPPGIQLAGANFNGEQTTGFDSRGLTRENRSGSVTVVGATRTFTLTLGLSGRVRME